MFWRKAFTYVVEILTSIEMPIYIIAFVQAWDRSAKYLLTKDKMSYKISWARKKKSKSKKYNLIYLCPQLLTGAEVRIPIGSFIAERILS